ncbi:DNA translocase FtsK 4TM domain-containing protein [Blattabacterium cuenoti]|uniref:DNA translocase FtsK 4TM domain-containing protein n=1 Tax=Blattabacterium cuenoti TaxID=1653831 RepID=UPI00163CE69A|nr:DNA translocase FtsK 4TM domain-containing protein [Blattabacterium cuenoti]
MNIKHKNNIKNNSIMLSIFVFSLLGISLFLFLSFFSFFFHWENDQSKLYQLLNNEVIAENLLGKIGAAVSHYFIYCGIGISAFFLPVLLFITGFKIFFFKKKFLNPVYISVIYKFIFFSIWIPLSSYIFFPYKGLLSGIMGFELGNLLINLFGKIGVYILIFISFIFYLIVNYPLFHKDRKKKILFYDKKKLCNTLSFSINSIKKNYRTKNDNDSNNQKPLHTILKKKTQIPVEIDFESNKKKIIEVLGYYNIKIFQVKTIIGPTVTVYEIYPYMGIRISKIKNLENEIALSLSVTSIRIIAPIPGKNSIGIEIPNSTRYIVYMKDILLSEGIEKKCNKMDLPISLGKTIFNETFIIDLTELPHLLIAGSTGQGKSVGLNVIIVFLLYKKKPEDIKFILIDPKKVELSIYKKISKSYFATIPNSINPIITNSNDTEIILNSLCKEMDKRYSILEKCKVRNIKEYNNVINKKKKYHLPYIIIIIDEFADLNISLKTKKIEVYITRLSQLARAVGIHLVIATQRPSVDVITGLIKSNFTARIAFKVSSKIDSRTILDCSGAEQLIGKGDLLFYNKNELIRLQCPFIDLTDIKKVIDYYSHNNHKKKEYLLPEPDVIKL